MSQLTLQRNGEGPSHTQFLYSSASSASTIQDSPTMGRTQIQTSLHPNASTTSGPAAASPLAPIPAQAGGGGGAGAHPTSYSLPSPTASFSSRSHRKAAPSPLQTTTTIAAASPSSSASPTNFDFPYPVRGFEASPTPQIVTTGADQSSILSTAPAKKSWFLSPVPSPSFPQARPFVGLPASPRLPNDSSRSASDPVLTSTPSEGSSARPLPAMAGPRVEAAKKGAPRNSSIDSAISAISTGSHAKGNSGDGSPAGTPDIAHLIQAAGSPEAVIQYLLKEKSAQAQQNSQLWRLVDKQRAMILGLNKDLERALKDKEKYRKKLKEVTSAPEVPPLPATAAPSTENPGGSAATATRSNNGHPVLEVPVSPVLGSGSEKHSPIDMALAPYPITPPADQPEAPHSAVGEMLDPLHSMPKPEEHALDQFDHDAEEREKERARIEADKVHDFPLNLSLPPSRSAPSEPPRVPPPRPPVPGAAPTEEGLGQFPLPPAPPPRKPPPAPLQLREAKLSPTFPREEELEGDSDDSDFDVLLQVAGASEVERRGRRRTREEDDKDREILALKEAEARSLSKKSGKSASSKGTPRINEPENIPASPRTIPANIQQAREHTAASLAGVLSGDNVRHVEVEVLAPPLLSPGLPSSPRPFGLSPLNSPPLSPRGGPRVGAGPLSPRPPRQPIPLPPNTPQQTPPTRNYTENMELRSPKPLNIVKKAMDALSGATSSTSPTKNSRGSPVEKPKVYTGFATDEYPDLLLPPNALPSIEIKVASSRMKPSRASLLSLTQLEEDPVFTLAIFSRGEGGELWRVEKDSASLAKLDHRLKQCAAFTAKTPDRSLFSGHAPAKLDARRVALDLYLDELLNTPLDTASALELCKYLSTNTLPPNTDETGSAVASSADSTNSQKTGPGGRPFRNGYLTKRGKNFGGWKARFFVLEGPQLRYYEAPGGAHLGTIKLQNAQIGKQSQNNDNASPARAPGNGENEIDNQYRHAFLILEPKKKDPTAMTKHVLCAESDVERDLWVDALLRWIDYRDPEDEDYKKDQSQAQGQGSQARAAGSSSSSGGKKKKSAAAAAAKAHHNATHHPSESNDTLISVSYETTQQGDAPHGAPAKSSHEHMPTMSSQGAFAISGPRDPQPIPDSASWGNRLGGGLAPPDEKKARKRSFFGFSKARTSSDGNDSLFGGDSSSVTAGGGGASGGSQTAYGGPVRQVFGAPLAEAVRYNSPVDVKVPLPSVVYRCIQYLEAKNAIHEEGIFRLSGSNVVIKQMRERFNTEGDVDLLADDVYHDIHAVTSLLKLYLRELPTTILTRDLHMEFLAVTEMPNSGAKIAALGELVERLPLANGTLLRYLIAFLVKIINNADTNKMTVRNVGIVFSPTLNIPAPVFAMFLQNYEGIFGVDPEEYELPSPSSDGHGHSGGGGSSVSGQQHQQHHQHQQHPSGGRRPSNGSLDQYPPRPGTSGTSDSPHRQRLVEAVQQRSSPTPPPMGGGQGNAMSVGGIVNPMMNLSQLSLHQTGGRSGASPTPPPMQMQPTSQQQQYYQQQQQMQQQLQQQQMQQQQFQQQQQQQQLSFEPQYASQQVSLRPAYDSGFVIPPGYDINQLRTPTGVRLNPGYDQPIYEGSNPASRRESAVFFNAQALNHQGSRSRLREEAHYG